METIPERDWPEAQDEIPLVPIFPVIMPRVIGNNQSVVPDYKETVVEPAQRETVVVLNKRNRAEAELSMEETPEVIEENSSPQLRKPQPK